MVEQKFAEKNDGFDSNGVSDLIGEREKKDGFLMNSDDEKVRKKDWFWTNGGIEICQKK